MRTAATRCHEIPNGDCLGCIAMAILYTERAIKKADKGGDVHSATDMGQTIQSLYFEFDGLCPFCGGTPKECPNYECQKEYE